MNTIELIVTELQDSEKGIMCPICLSRSFCSHRINKIKGYLSRLPENQKREVLSLLNRDFPSMDFGTCASENEEAPEWIKYINSFVKFSNCAIMIRDRKDRVEMHKKLSQQGYKRVGARNGSCFILNIATRIYFTLDASEKEASQNAGAFFICDALGYEPNDFLKKFMRLASEGVVYKNWKEFKYSFLR